MHLRPPRPTPPHTRMPEPMCFRSGDGSAARRDRHDRLGVAVYQGEPLFKPAAIRLLVKGSGGIPRLLNILANKCLMAAFGEGQRRVGSRHVRRALADTEGARSFLRAALPLRWALLVGVATVSLLLSALPWLSQLAEVRL